MGASLRAGLAALPAAPTAAASSRWSTSRWSAAPPSARLVQSPGGDGAAAAVATYDGRPRNPVLLDRAVWAEVAAGATGDGGARDWLRAPPRAGAGVPCDGTGSPYDVDTPEDLGACSAPCRFGRKSA